MRDLHKKRSPSSSVIRHPSLLLPPPSAATAAKYSAQEACAYLIFYFQEYGQRQVPRAERTAKQTTRVARPISGAGCSRQTQRRYLLLHLLQQRRNHQACGVVQADQFRVFSELVELLLFRRVPFGHPCVPIRVLFVRMGGYRIVVVDGDLWQVH